MDEINYSIKSGWDEIRDYDGITVIIGKTIEEFEEEVRKYRILNEWGTKEIENIKFLHAEAITRKKNPSLAGTFQITISYSLEYEILGGDLVETLEFDPQIYGIKMRV